MKSVNHLLISLFFWLGASCESQPDKEVRAIIGRWKTEVIDSEMGRVNHELIFEEDRGFTHKMIFSDGDVTESKGTFRLKGGSQLITSYTIEGEEIKSIDLYAYGDDGSLFITKEGEKYRFSKIKTSEK